MYEKICWPSDRLLEKVRVNMTVKDLFVFARHDVRIVLEDGFYHTVFAGKFENVPYRFINCNICDYYIKDNKLVIEIYD